MKKPLQQTEAPQKGTPAAPFRHENNPKPMTRRDLLAQGFIGSSAFVLMPSLLSMIANRDAYAAAVCSAPGGTTRMMPVIVFDLGGGGNIAGSNIIVGKRGGQSDFLPSYS